MVAGYSDSIYSPLGQSSARTDFMQNQGYGFPGPERTAGFQQRSNMLAQPVFQWSGYAAPQMQQPQQSAEPVNALAQTAPNGYYMTPDEYNSLSSLGKKFYDTGVSSGLTSNGYAVPFASLGGHDMIPHLQARSRQQGRAYVTNTDMTTGVTTGGLFGGERFGVDMRPNIQTGGY